MSSYFIVVTSRVKISYRESKYPVVSTCGLGRIVNVRRLCCMLGLHHFSNSTSIASNSCQRSHNFATSSFAAVQFGFEFFGLGTAGAVEVGGGEQGFDTGDVAFAGEGFRFHSFQLAGLLQAQLTAILYVWQAFGVQSTPSSTS